MRRAVGNCSFFPLFSFCYDLDKIIFEVLAGYFSAMGLEEIRIFKELAKGSRLLKVLASLPERDGRECLGHTEGEAACRPWTALTIFTDY